MPQRRFVARHFPVYTLLIRIAPAGVHPDLSVDTGELAIECLGKKVEIGIRALWLLGALMMRRLLHLDQSAAGRAPFTALRVLVVRELASHLLLAALEPVSCHHRVHEALSV